VVVFGSGSGRVGGVKVSAVIEVESSGASNTGHDVILFPTGKRGAGGIRSGNEGPGTSTDQAESVYVDFFIKMCVCVCVCVCWGGAGVEYLNVPLDRIEALVTHHLRSDDEGEHGASREPPPGLPCPLELQGAVAVSIPPSPKPTGEAPHSQRALAQPRFSIF
jgi:hypothetical protein